MSTGLNCPIYDQERQLFIEKNEIELSGNNFDDLNNLMINYQKELGKFLEIIWTKRQLNIYKI